MSAILEESKALHDKKRLPWFRPVNNAARRYSGDLLRYWQPSHHSQDQWLARVRWHGIRPLHIKRRSRGRVEGLRCAARELQTTVAQLVWVEDTCVERKPISSVDATEPVKLRASWIGHNVGRNMDHVEIGRIGSYHAHVGRLVLNLSSRGCDISSPLTASRMPVFISLHQHGTERDEVQGGCGTRSTGVHG
jgi:hypothetical protein